MTAPASSPASLSGHAAENLAFIRSTMERAAGFSALPGWGGVGMGATALVAALVAHDDSRGPAWLAWWLLEAVVAVSIGSVALVRKARRSGLALSGPAARTFALAFVPALAAGAALTAILWGRGMTDALPAVWLLLYGAAVTSAGACSIRLVPAMGLALMALGALATLAPAAWGDAFMATGFGGLHIAFGIAIARRHGG